MSIDFDSFEEPVTKVFNKDEITVGRKPGNDLVLDRPEVSSYHAKLYARPNGGGKQKLFVTDLGSSNGTLLERDPLRPDAEATVQPNQRLIIGSYLLKPSIIENTDEITDSLFESSYQETRSFEEPQSPDTLLVERELGSNGEMFKTGSSEFLDVPLLRDQPRKESAASAPQPEYFSTGAAPLVTLQVEGESIADIDFDAVQLFSISGRVTHKGEGLSAVKIDAGELGKFETDSDGRFHIPNIADATDYRLMLSKEKFVLEPSVLTGSLTGNEDLHVAATRLFQLSGRVLHRGAPLSDVRIDAGSVGRVTTGPDGRFFFRDLRDGTKYTIHADRDRYLFDVEGTDGVVDRDIELTVSARRLVTVSGRVVHKGTPLSDVQIECINLGKTTTDSEGRYEFENVPEGAEYVFTAQKPGFKFSQARRA